MSLYRSASALLVILLLAGCSGVEEKRQAYRQSDSIGPLQIPAGLNTPVSEDALMLPELQSRPAVDAPPFDSRPPAPSNLPAETAPEVKE